ncbi:MAG: hypothetical protein JSV02_05585 [Dehalococcoidia bacterium]|nr:MAG: hypothetical protein JSV02_05585 [Dehalococcoidia bacterium]
MVTKRKLPQVEPVLQALEPQSKLKSGQHRELPERFWHQEQGMMPSVALVSPYKPIICGIADYSYFLTREAPPHRWDVLSFNLDNYGVPLCEEQSPAAKTVWYGINSRDDFSAASIEQGLRPRSKQVLWFQHEFGIWRGNARFVKMLRELNTPKVVTLHTLHFQSIETRYGLRSEEYFFLRAILPHADAITVFSDGVYQAVAHAFPEHIRKVHVLRHGIHSYPEISKMSKLEAKARVHKYLIEGSELDRPLKEGLAQERIFLDPNTVIIGGTGFITASKGTELLYRTHDVLQQMLPSHRIAAVYVGKLREADNNIDSRFATQMKAIYNGAGQFFLDTYLPVDMLATVLRALDIYFYWPGDCTQSGIIAHALGAGATMACRDMEGVGETVRMAGGLTSANLEELISGIKQAIVFPEFRVTISERALRYAKDFSWKNQLWQHLKLAEQLTHSRDRYMMAGVHIASELAGGPTHSDSVSAGHTAPSAGNSVCLRT